jgi:hypothetical protein
MALNEYPPAQVLATLILLVIATAQYCANIPRQKPIPKPTSTLALVVLRLVFLANICSTFRWSYTNLSHLLICDDDGNNCMLFAGIVQFSTFTRWCWMIQGLYYFTAILHHLNLMPARVCRILFGISLSSALLVTTITYCVLVPGATLIDHPAHKQGLIDILLSWSGHVMHSTNTLMIFTDMYFSRQSMERADIVLAVYWGALYVVFEWVFHFYTGAWHYPFLNYNNLAAPVIYAVLLFVLCGFYILGCNASAAALPEKSKSKKAVEKKQAKKQKRQ